MKNHICNALILLLVAAILAVTFLNVTIGFGLFRAEPTASSPVLTTGSPETDRYVRPEFIGVKGSQLGDFAMMANANTVAALYDALAPYLDAALSYGACRVDDTPWQDLLAADNIIYLRYHTELRAALIAAHLSAKSGDDCLLLAAGENPVIRELLLTMSGDTRADFSLTVRGNDGTVYRYSPPTGGYSVAGKPLRFDVESFALAAKLPNRFPFTFFAEASVSGVSALARISPSQFITEEPPSTNGIVSVPTERGLSEPFLSALGFAPSAYGRYEDGDSTVYVSTHGTLRVGDAAFSFRATAEGGLVLGHLGGDGAAYDLLRLAEFFATTLKQAGSDLVGGDAELLLNALTRDGDTVQLDFGYYIDNLPVLDADRRPLGLSVRVENGTVTAADGDKVNILRRAYLVKNYQTATVLRLLSSSANAETGSILRLVYRLSDADSYTEWILESR